MLASISDNVLASSEGIPRAREANQAVPKLLIAGPRAYPAFVGIQSDIREDRPRGALKPRVLARAVATQPRHSTTRRCWCTACMAGAR
jgi:hypothetical protein